MILVPYKLDGSLSRIPILTILVCAICVATFVFQLDSRERFEAKARLFCSSSLSGNQQAIVDHVEDDDIGRGCVNVFMAIRGANDRDRALSTLAAEVRGLDFYSDPDRDLNFKRDALSDAYAQFEIAVPRELTESIVYRPGGYNPVTMITSTFAHASWLHLIGNLFFFFAFATCVECMLGAAHFALCFVVMAIVTSLAYSHSMAGTQAVPTLGLSGIAMGMMALMAVLLPRARIWFFLWFLLWVRRFRIPVLIISAWYIGWNFYDLRNDHASSINYMAHVSGAICGLTLGLAYRVFGSRRLGAVTAGTTPGS